MTKTTSRIWVAALGALCLASAASAQEREDFQSTPLEASDTQSTHKAIDGRVSVIVKFDLASVAAYRGGISGLAATSPQATGRARLDPRSDAARAYTAHLAANEARFRVSLAARIPGARVVHRFRNIVAGVSVVLPLDRVKALAAMPGVAAVYPDVPLPLLTDRSPEFIGAPALWAQVGGQHNAGQGVVVGILDSGIWPEHPSVADDGSYPPPPATWLGSACEFGSAKPGDAAFACNNKLIGADRQMLTFDSFGGGAGTPLAGEYFTARDNNGHGSHVATTAVGNAGVVSSPGPELSGIAPRAHLAVYKVCFTVPTTGQGSCYTSDSAAAIEQAIDDGVDVLNFSIGGGSSPFSDVVSLAFLDAYKAGVFVAAAGGNSGPGANTVDHREPWVTTAAASTTDKGFRGSAALTAAAGDLALTGASATGDLTTPSPVVVSATAPGYSNDLCLVPAAPGTFTGRIAVCRRGTNARVSKSANVAAGGAVGMILYNNTDAESLNADSHAVPSLHVNGTQGAGLLAYLLANPGAVGTIAGGALDLTGQGDVTASFSSRGGPNQTLGISKPDLAAPGVNILAANTPFLAEPTLPQGQLYQIISGTSMASPHVAGAGALLRQLHPDWTPGQIKSALMMTARTEDVVKENGVTPATPFDVGSGRIDLNVAGNPGFTISDSGDNFIALSANLSVSNYPSLYLPVLAGKVDVPRTLQSVDSESREWALAVESPADLAITVPASVSLAAGAMAPLTISVDASAVPIGQTRHARLVFTSSAAGGETVLTFPITIVRKQGAVALTKTCTPLTLQKGEATECTIQATNTTFSAQTVHVADQVPPELEVQSVSGGAQSGNLVTFDGPLAGAVPPQIGIQPGDSPFGYFSLRSLGVGRLGTTGDETLSNFTLGGNLVFQYGGQTYNRFGVGSNGYIVVGGGTAADISFINQNLPNGTVPNNVLAPFWTDLNATVGLLPSTAGIRVATLTAGPDVWLVVEWDAIPNYSSAAQVNTFQVWIKVAVATPPPQTIAFAYGTTTSGDGGFLTVGAENALGNSGGSYYFNGTGTLPTPATELIVTGSAAAPGETHTTSFTAGGKHGGPWRNCAEMQAPALFGTSTACVSGEVTPAPLTVTVNSASKVYGSANPAFSVSYSGFLGGDDESVLGGTLAFSTAADVASPVGVYPVSASGLTSSDYAISYVDGTLQVTPAGLVVRVNDSAKVYGSANPAFTLSYFGLVAGDGPGSLLGTPSFATAADATSPVGFYPVAVSGLNSPNYNIVFAPGTLQVVRAPLTIEANDASRVEGAANAPFSASYTGFVGADSPASLTGTLVFSTTATPASPPGDYPIVPSGVSSTNYAITFVNGTLTVDAGPNGKMYGLGQIGEGRTHHHFAFRVSQDNKREYARLEYWANEDRRCHFGDHDFDRRGHDDRDYGRDHKNPPRRFESTSIAQVIFSDDPAFKPGRNKKPIVDSVIFSGRGKWNGKSGYTFEVRAADKGEPGRRRDSFALIVKDKNGAVVLRLDDTLDAGNVESTRLRWR